MRLAWSRFGYWRVAVAGVLVLAVVVGFAFFWNPGGEAGRDEPHPGSTEVTEVGHQSGPDAYAEILFPKESWDAAGVKIEPVIIGEFAQTVELTGKVALNEDRVAHVFPLVEGRVEEVKVKLGDRVKKDDLLVVVQSTEVGRSMLQLFQDRLKRDLATTRNQWTQTVAANTQKMIQLMRANATIEEIEAQLTDQLMGDYRNQLVTAYVEYYKSQQTLDRLTPLSGSGAVPGKRLMEAEADRNADRATLQSMLEQCQQEVRQAATRSKQALTELETQVAVEAANLKILGFDDQALASVDPMTQGEAISHYPIQSPFDGTIISKDVVLLERVGPESQILSIADLSSVWITTDIYEEHLPLVHRLENRTIEVRSRAWPDRKFDAEIFYTGDLVEESSRTLSLRAIASNSEGLLKPGMFVNVRFPMLTRPQVTQVPLTAIQDHAGETFVFVHRQGDLFERRKVVLGEHNSDAVEIVEGLSPGDAVVTAGGFALKSQMLSELLSE